MTSAGGSNPEESAPPPERSEPPSSGFRHAAKTSLAVFQSHLVWTTPASGGSPVCDARGIISRACYEDWYSSRGSHPPGEPEKTFQRIITAHLTGSDGRRPFSKAEEEAILLVLREKRVWPAFEGTSLSIGTKGFRSHGWNEKREAEQAEAAAHAAVAAASGAGGQRALHSQRPSKLTKTTSSSSSSVAAAAAAAAVVATTTSPGLVPMQQQPAGSYAPWLTQGSAAAYAFPPWLSLPPAPQLAFTPVTSLAAAPYNNNNPASGSPSPPLANGPLPSVFSDSAALEVSDDALIVHAVLPSLLCICFPDEAPLPPTTESALNCLAAFEARHPGIPAVAVNLAAPSINDVIIAQNAVSVRHVGIVSRLMSGTYRHLVPQTHVVALAKQVIVSTSVEGRESTLPLCAVRLVDGESLVNLIVAVDGAVVVIGALL